MGRRPKFDGLHKIDEPCFRGFVAGDERKHLGLDVSIDSPAEPGGQCAALNNSEERPGAWASVASRGANIHSAESRYPSRQENRFSRIASL